MQELQAAGLAAGAVQDIEDLLESDAPLQARGALVPLVHARLGPFGHVRTPLSFSRDCLEPFRPPGLGEHSLSVAQEIAGLSAPRIAELKSLEVFT